MNTKENEQKYELASQEKLKELGDMEDIFFAYVVQCPEALVTDESMLADFLGWYDASTAVGPGSTPNTRMFKVIWGKRDKQTGKMIKLPPVLEEHEPSFEWDNIVARCKEILGFDLTNEHKRKHIPDLLQEIAASLPDIKRAKLLECLEDEQRKHIKED